MNRFAFRDCIRFDVIIRPARKDNDLKGMRLLREEGTKPVHPRFVALNELIVENDRALEVFGQRQPV
jgi:hypothetical protein